MPERTEQLILFPNQGLYLTGPKRMVPRTHLRRALGINETNIGSIKNRKGETTLYSLSSIHSLGRLNTDRYQGVAGVLYRNGVSLLTGGDGNRLTLLKGQPSEGLADYLFLSGGNQSRKITSAGVVTNWGISPPPNGMVITKNANTQKQIEDFEDHTTWTYTNVSAHANEGTIKQQGTNSLHLTILANQLAVIRKASVLDLSTYGGGVSSPDEDHTEFWVRIGSSPGFDYILIRFDVGTGNFATDFYQFKILPTQDTPRNDRFGIGVSPLVNQQEEIFLTGDRGGEGGSGSDAPAGEGSGSDSSAASDPGPGGDAGSGPGDGTDAVAGPNTWTRIRVPKSSFFRSGAGSGTWANVAAIQFTIKSNSFSTIEIYLDDAELIGAVGMEGRYRYHSTFRNTTTGNSSNPEPTYIQVEDINRQSTAGSLVSLSSDPQVNQRELWRTVGNGTVFFRAFTLNDNTTTIFTDTVADYIGLNSLVAAAYLQPTVLSYNNAKPDDTYGDFLIDGLTAFWLSNEIGKRGRLYYSTIGKPEGVKGFITVTNDNDILQRILVYNGVKYILSLDGIYRIDGTDPYTRRRITGVPGLPTTNKRTPVVSPYGIFYQANDGIRIFDGNRSELVFYERLGNIFRGETLDYFPPFEGVYGAFYHNQYIISDNIRTLSLNLNTGLIRELGIGLNALLFEDDTKLLIGEIGRASCRERV